MRKRTDAAALEPQLCSLRGAVLPLIDLSQRLGRGANAALKRAVFIVVDIHEEPLGLVVDPASDILRIDRSLVQATDTMASGAAHQMLDGLRTIENQIVSRLNLNRVKAPQMRQPA